MIQTEHTGFIKDDTPGQLPAILNIDNEGFKAYMAARERELSLQTVTKDVENLKHDINEIKNLLKILVGNKQ